MLLYKIPNERYKSFICDSYLMANNHAGYIFGKRETGDIFEYTSVVHSLSTSHPLVHSGGVLEDMCMCYNLGHTLQQWSYKFWP